MKTFFLILNNYIIIKIILTALLIFGLVLITAPIYVENGFSAFEYTLILLSDKFMLSLFWMTGLIIWNCDLFSLRNEKGLLAFKSGSTRKWSSINGLALVIRALLFSVEIVICIIAFSILLGMTLSNRWSPSAIYSTVDIVDGLDYYGHPFINLIDQSLPIYGILRSIPLLVARSLVYSLMAVIVFSISYNMGFAYVITAMINYLDIYCCSYFSYEGTLFMPYAYSTVTSIAGNRPSSMLILLYWLLLIGIMTITSYSVFTNRFEIIFANQNKTRE